MKKGEEGKRDKKTVFGRRFPGKKGDRSSLLRRGRKKKSFQKDKGKK